MRKFVLHIALTFFGQFIRDEPLRMINKLSAYNKLQSYLVTKPCFVNYIKPEIQQEMCEITVRNRSKRIATYRDPGKSFTFIIYKTTCVIVFKPLNKEERTASPYPVFNNLQFTI